MKSSSNNAFTLIEVVVVLGIIGLLITLGANSYLQFSKKSRDAKRTGDLQEVKQALEMYRSQEGFYPTPCPTDAASCPGGLPFGQGKLIGLNNNLYSSVLPQDPKGNTYIYKSVYPYQTYRLCTNLEAGQAYVIDPYGENGCNLEVAVVPTAIPTLPGGGGGGGGDDVVCSTQTIGTALTLGKICM